MARVTLKTVAERVGVSPMTVSNAFSRPDQLSAALREKILATAAELGYAGPDPAARTLARGATGTVGILFHGSPRYAFSDEFAARFLAVIAEELGHGGLALTLLPNAGTPEVLPVRDVAMDGAIIYSCSTTESSFGWLRKRRLPLVLVDEPDDADLGAYSSVNVDDRAGARAAAAHLVALGHRRIAVLTVGPPAPRPGDFFVAQERMRGWRDVLEPAGIAPAVRHLHEAVEGERVAAARELLTGPDRPTAVLCFADFLGADVLGAAADLGLRVPTDLSVVGFDDSSIARRLNPPLTTVRQDVDAKGSLAAAELIKAVRRRRAGEPDRVRRHLLPTELVVRGT
ncbi:MAG TPA: LacI family DNA-binding transcriptional regulator, partial [Pseudonocardia sp.]|nr:LacI family DNA-binding transcriptional regulator [Pseudonocardia sp.]